MGFIKIIIINRCTKCLCTKGARRIGGVKLRNYENKRSNYNARKGYYDDERSNYADSTGMAL